MTANLHWLLSALVNDGCVPISAEDLRLLRRDGFLLSHCARCDRGHQGCYMARTTSDFDKAIDIVLDAQNGWITFEEAKHSGMQIRRGSKSRRRVWGRPVFSPEQYYEKERFDYDGDYDRDYDSCYWDYYPHLEDC